MKTSVKLNLLFQDRVGIIADVSDVLAQADFNIVSMEVERKEDTAEIYLEAESGGKLQKKSAVFEILKDIKDLQSIKFVKTLPGQRRENMFRIILDNVSDGIISIDKDRKIISEVMELSGSIRKAAGTLGISHTTLLNKMKKHDIRFRKV